ncbi:uncharacterized protein ARMOST_20356 [Armillaria ostoyae]|uniref:Uncharacterized protein n=1 Tax=Armillaria ostoyae TaxID=47428 RepID=A0A284S734_ARMOS|nr:uncharacterized protein ARMOST_20356 [Armillaria ostoyae]
MEEKYEEALEVHKEWKAIQVKEAWLEKLMVDKEARVEKLKSLQKLEEEQKVAEEKKMEEERQAAILKEKQEAEEKPKELDELKAKEIADVAAKKKQDDLKKREEKKLQKEQKKKEKAAKAGKGNGAVRTVEAALVDKEKGMDGDTEGEKSEATKEKALQKLREKCDRKQKASESAVSTVGGGGGGKKQKCPMESSSVVAESKEEGVPGPSKKMKVEVTGPAENEKELEGNKYCIWCRQDRAKCFTHPGSMKTSQGHTCSCCKTKKAACSFNKGNSVSITVSSEEVSDALQKLMSTVNALVNKVDQLTGEVIFLQSCVRDFIDNFDTEDIQSPEDMLSVSNVEEWNVSCLKLEDLKGINSKALQRVMQWRLDKDMVQLQAQGPAEPKKMNTDDPYEISNCEFWYSIRGAGKLEEMKLQMWKAYLHKHHCKEFFVEDSDLWEEILDGKVQKVQKPYRPDLSIAALDGLFLLDNDPKGVTTSEDDEDSLEGEESESAGGEEDAPVEGVEDVEMKEVADVMGAKDT